MTGAASRLLVEYERRHAVTTLAALVARRVDLENRLAPFDAGTVINWTDQAWLEVPTQYADGLRRELRDVEAAEATLRAALNVPADDWGGIEQYQAEDR